MFALLLHPLMIFYPNDFCHKRKIEFDLYNVLLATNIPMLLVTGFVVQGHICYVL